MRRWKVALIAVLALALGFGLGTLRPIVDRPPLVVGQDAVTDAASASVVVRTENVGGTVLHILPTGERRVALILYPGGLVRPQAYEWLGRALAARGVETWIPEMPADLAVLGKDRADALVERIGPGTPVVLAGHSLGGAMAADYASRHADRVHGLILMASYPAQDVTVRAPWPALSLLAERDEVADAAAVRAGVGRLPAGSRLVVIPGAVHAFFGRYGPQAGDGVPTVSRADAEAAILGAASGYLDAVR